MTITILPEPSLRERTTLRLGGSAIAEVAAADERGLDGLPEVLADLGGAPFVLGAGSNILAMDGTLPLVLVRVPWRLGPESVTAQEGRTRTARIRAGAGLGLQRLLGWLQARGLSGLEPLTGVPGNVGGAAAMNAGSYGREFTGLMTGVRIWTPQSGDRWLTPIEWEASYRHFRPRLAEGEGPWLVLEVELELERKDPAEVRAAMRGHYARKKATQPLKAASAGCVFKNPPGESAGKLLDQAGFRGRRLGGMVFSEVHANFLVNAGGGTSGEALELIDMARGAVLERFGVELALEVKVIPCH